MVLTFLSFFRSRRWRFLSSSSCCCFKIRSSKSNSKGKRIPISIYHPHVHGYMIDKNIRVEADERIELIMNTTHNVIQLCNGSCWQSLNKTSNRIVTLINILFQLIPCSVKVPGSFRFLRLSKRCCTCTSQTKFQLFICPL